VLTCPYSFTFQNPVALQQLQVAPMLLYNIFDSVCQQSNPENMTVTGRAVCLYPFPQLMKVWAQKLLIIRGKEILD